MINLRILRVCAFALAIAVSSGCTMIRIGYGQLDTLAAWRADEYFDLDPPQEQDFRARFDRLHEWHRYQQLPEYVVFLTETTNRLQKQPTREDVNWFVDGLKERYRVLIRRAVPDAAALLAPLRQDQIDALKRQWEKDNRRFAREHHLKADPEDRKRHRAERSISQIKEWTGALTSEQEQRITALSDKLPPNSDLRYQDRLRRQREFLKLLETRTSADFAPRLSRWLEDWESGRPPEHKRAFDEAWNRRVDFYVAVYQLLTQQQRATIARRVQNYAEDFKFLAERSPGQAAAR